MLRIPTSLNERSKMKQTMPHKDPKNPASIRGFRLIGNLKSLCRDILEAYALFSLNGGTDGEKGSLLIITIQNALMFKIGINAWNVFGDTHTENEINYLRLVKDGWNCKEQIIDAFGSNTSDMNPEHILNSALLKFSKVDTKEFKKSKRLLEKYRNKYAAHREDFLPESEQDQIFFPHLEIWAKLSFGLLKCIEKVEEVNCPENMEINVNLPKLEMLDSFDDKILEFKKLFCLDPLLNFTKSKN